MSASSWLGLVVSALICVYLLYAFLILLFARFIIDLVMAFSRGFRPSGALLVVFEIVFGRRRQRGADTAAQVGFLAVEREGAGCRRTSDQRAIGQGQQPPQPRLRAHRGMKRPSQRDRTAVILFHERLIVVLDRG